MKYNTNLSIAILTTETIHHSYFVKKLGEIYKNIRVFIDTQSSHPPFAIEHIYESARDQHELYEWFNGNIEQADLTKISDCITVEDINSSNSISELTQFNADIHIIFGTKKISSVICEKFAKKIVNLHGGDPQKYRGLDSHLWSLYHKDRRGLVTTLHEVNPVLDDGNIVSQKRLNFTNITDLSQIRKENTELCVSLVLDFLRDFSLEKTITSTKQTSIGRYYSYMPTVLKEVVYTNFKNGKYDDILR